MKINYFGLVPEEISNVEEWIAALRLFVGTLREIETMEDTEIDVGRFKNIVNQLSSELYYRCKTKECVEVEEIMKIYTEVSLKLE